MEPSVCIPRPALSPLDHTAPGTSRKNITTRCFSHITFSSVDQVPCFPLGPFTAWEYSRGREPGSRLFVSSCPWLDGTKWDHLVLHPLVERCPEASLSGLF